MNNEYCNMGIMFPCFNDNNEIIFPYGTIINSNDGKFKHDCNTKHGNSGAPVILVNNIKIIGIHTGYSPEFKKNIGRYFQNIVYDHDILNTFLLFHMGIGFVMNQY